MGSFRNILLALLILLASAGWTPARQDGYSLLRETMVTRQLAQRGVDDPGVLAAMRTVPRHRFVPAENVILAYIDSPLPIGYGQTISQPFMVGYMCQVAGLDSTSRVLEVGTGSGYHASVISRIVDTVYTIEIIPQLAERAKGVITSLGYDNIVTRSADGYYGWPETAPFDAIVVTAAPDHIPPPLIEQLAEGGRMVIPVGDPFLVQYLVLVEKINGEVRSRQLMPVSFVPFTGGH